MNPITNVHHDVLVALRALAARGVIVKITATAANGHHADIVLTQPPQGWAACAHADGWTLPWRGDPTLVGAILATLTEASESKSFRAATRTFILRQAKAIRAVVSRATEETTR